mgnify:FL=1
MKVLIICAADRSNYFIALNAIKFINKSKLDDVTVCVLDNNKEIINYLKKNKIRYFNKNLDTFFYNIKNNYYDWLLNIWGFKIFKKKFLDKFRNNLNLHPAYLPYNRGRDPYYFSIINRTPVGICIHKMDESVDGGEYYLREKINYKFPITAGEIFNKSLKNIKNLFIKNWLNIRTKKIKLKKYNIKIKTVNKRKDLILNNFKDLDIGNNKKIKKFILNCLAQDFDFLKQQIKIFGKIYNCELKLKEAKKKKW